MTNTDAPHIDPDGWISVPGPDGQGGVHARVRGIRDGRAVITDLYVHGPEITSALVRAVPIGRIEAMANIPGAGAVGDKVARAAMSPKQDITLAELRKRVPRRARPPAKREPLVRPDGTDPDAFSRRVAEAYTAAVLTTSRPAKVLADEAGVPVTTVHRWIREARQRGYLPPARKGRAG